ncbi:MAG: hypothetical protein ACKVOU_11845 [Cytophagales bacterium]
MKSKKIISIDQFIKNTGEVPDNYFQKMEVNIIHKTVAMAQLKEKMVFILHSKPAEFQTININEGYFAKLEETILEKTSEIYKVQPWLISKQEINFEVPNGYFDQLSSKIKERIPVQKQPNTQWEWLPNMASQPIYLMAATFLIFTFAYVFLQLTTNKNTENTMALIDNLSKEEIASYIAMKSDEIEASSLPSAVNWEENINQHQLSASDVNDLILTDEL